MLSGEDIADLFDPTPRTGKRWIDQIPEDAQDWCREVAGLIKERGREPNSWAAVGRKFEERFGKTYIPRSHQTLMNSIRTLVRE